MLSLGREASLSQEDVLVQLRFAFVTYRDLGLAFDCQRHELAEIDVVLKQMVEHFPPLEMHTKPESNQQVELELLGPSLATL